MSRHRQMHYQMLNSFEKEYRAGGDDSTRFHIAYPHDDPRPDAAVISADSIYSQYDIPALVNEASVPSGVPVINLGVCNDDPIVVQAIKERIDALTDN